VAAEGGADAAGGGVGGLGSAILKPDDNFYVRWEYLHIFVELYKNIQA